MSNRAGKKQSSLCGKSRAEVEEVIKFGTGIFEMSYRTVVHACVCTSYFEDWLSKWGKRPWGTSQSWIEDWMMK